MVWLDSVDIRFRSRLLFYISFSGSFRLFRDYLFIGLVPYCPFGFVYIFESLIRPLYNLRSLLDGRLGPSSHFFLLREAFPKVCLWK